MAMKVYLTLFVFLLIYVRILSSTAIPISSGQSFVSNKEEEIPNKKLFQGMRSVQVADPKGNTKEILKMEVSIDYSGPKHHNPCDPNDPTGCPYKMEAIIDYSGPKHHNPCDPNDPTGCPYKMEASIDYSGPKHHSPCDPNDPTGCPHKIIRREN